MAKLQEIKRDVYEEETSFRKSVSEAVAQKLGNSINFINNRQYDSHQFNFNGQYALGVGVVGADGIFPILFDMEIMGFTMYNRRAGISGTTTIDLQWLSDSNVNNGSIFSTKPSISSAAPNNSYMIKNILTGTDIKLPTGGTSPVLSKTSFVAGDAILCVIDSAMSGGETMAVMIHYRPI